MSSRWPVKTQNIYATAHSPPGIITFIPLLNFLWLSRQEKYHLWDGPQIYLCRSFFNYLYLYLPHSIIAAGYGFHNKPNRPLIAFHIGVLKQDDISFLKVSFFLRPLSPYLQCCKIVSPPCLPESISQTLNLSPFFLVEVLHVKVSKRCRYSTSLLCEKHWRRQNFQCVGIRRNRK